MDPLGDLFSFINTNVLKEEERVNKFLKDNSKNFETKKRKIKKRCKLCEVGEIHEECMTVDNLKTRGKTTDGEYVCDKCEYTSDKKKNLGYHEKAVHLKLKRYKCSACLHLSHTRGTLQIHVKSKQKHETCIIITIALKHI